MKNIKKSLFSMLSPHLHSSEHGSDALTHLQRPRQPLLGSQPQRMSFLHTFDASGIVIHTTSYPSFSDLQPQSEGFGRVADLLNDWAQQYAT